MAIVGIQRALIRRKLESQRIDVSPSKFAVTSFKFGEDDDEDLLSNSSLLDKSAVMLSDAPFDPRADESRDDGDDDDDEPFGERVRDERDTAAASPPPQALSTPAGTHVYGANLYNDPVNVTVTNTPQSFLHGMILIEEGEEKVSMADHVHVQATPAPKKICQGKLFQSSPITQPDEMQGQSFLDESLDYSINDDTPQPSPNHHQSTKNDSSYSPSTMFASSPLTSEQDDSLLQTSMSSFIKNDDSMIMVERDLFDCSTKKEKKKAEEEETPTMTLHDNNKLDMRVSIQPTATEAFTFKESLHRTKPLISFSDGEGDDEYDDALDMSQLGMNLSRLGIDTSEQQHLPPFKEDSRASSSPTGVIDFFQDEGFESSLPPPPPLHPSAPPPPAAAPPMTSFMTQLLNQLSACHHPCSSAVHNKTKKQQQPDTAIADKSRIPAFSTERPELVQKAYSPAQELSLARKRANSTQRSLRRGRAVNK